MTMAQWMVLLAVGGCEVFAVDSDGDGLDDGLEAVLGSDPQVADTDGDSWLDGEEAEAGTSPLDRWDWPQGEGWPDFSAEAPIGARSYAMGSPMPDFTAVDADGAKVRLDQFAGYVRLIELTAGWCGPCRPVAAEDEAEYQARRLDGFMSIHLVLEDETASSESLAAWREEFGLTFPVISNASQSVVKGLFEAQLFDGGIPYRVLLDRQGRIDSVYGAVDHSARVDELLAEPLP